MDPVLISNQVYQAIQLETLEEPKAKSTILYANRYSGLGEIPISDSELLSVLNSTSGNAGNNVLVQLKQKMSAFRNGPWYIDSKNGAIYIHNRKYTTGSAYNYTYNAENGELLMASFRMVEVNRGIEGLSGFVNAVTKAVGILNQKVEAVNLEEVLNQAFEAKFTELGIIGPGTKAPQKKETDRERELRLEKNWAAARKESQRKKKEYDARSPQEKAKAWRDKQDIHKKHVENADPVDVHKYIQNKNSLYKLAYEYYMDCVKNFGKNSPEAKSAKADVERQASRVNIPLQNYGRDWGYYSITLTTARVGTSPNIPLPESKKQKAIQDAIDRWYNSRGYKMRASDFKPVNVVWKFIDINNPNHIHSDIYTSWYQATFTLNFWGLAIRGDSVRGDRLIRGILDRYPNKGGGNPATLISNAAANMGRRKREKRMQASIRTVGNPLLEVGMQIELQNVGQKQSGLWYIHQITHSLEHGQGYICDVILSRQEPKAGTSGTNSEIHTQAYTTDNDTASTSNTTVRSNKPSSGKSSNKSKANVVKGNSEHSYQSYYDEPLTVEEVNYITQRASTGRSETETNEIIAEELIKVASIRAVNKEKGTKYKYVTSTVDPRTGQVTLHVNKTAVNKAKSVKRKAGTSRYFNYLMDLTNRRKKK